MPDIFYKLIVAMYKILSYNINNFLLSVHYKSIMKGTRYTAMNETLDYELVNVAKEKRTKKMSEKTVKKHSKAEDFDKFDTLLGKKKFNHKNEKAFRKNQKRFEYDYEEDFYEPENY